LGVKLSNEGKKEGRVRKPEKVDDIIKSRWEDVAPRRFRLRVRE